MDDEKLRGIAGEIRKIATELGGCSNLERLGHIARLREISHLIQEDLATRTTAVITKTEPVPVPNSDYVYDPMFFLFPEASRVELFYGYQNYGKGFLNRYL